METKVKNSFLFAKVELYELFAIFLISTQAPNLVTIIKGVFKGNIVINQLQPGIAFLYPLKTSENL